MYHVQYVNKQFLYIRIYTIEKVSVSSSLVSVVQRLKLGQSKKLDVFFVEYSGGGSEVA